MLIKTPLLHQSSGPCVFLSLSLSFRLIPWSSEALWVHFPAWASETLSRRCSAPSPYREGAWGLREQSKPRARGFIGFLCKPRNTSLFLSLLSYHRLWTTRFRSIKGPQQSVVLFLQLCAQNVLYSFSLTLFGSEASQRSYASVVVLPFLLFYI